MSGRRRTGLVWFRRDLRLADNPALRRALAECEQVIPVYLGAFDQDAEWPTGSASRSWLHASLDALDAALRERGSRLVFADGPAIETLDSLVDRSGATAVYWNRLYEPRGIARDRELKTHLQARDIVAVSCQAQLLFEPWEIASGNGTPYKVSTPFLRRCMQQAPPRRTLPAPRDLQPPARWPRGCTLRSLRLTPRPRWDKAFWAEWTPGERGARKQLQRFLRSGLADYGQLRDRPAEDGVSRLSPHLHFGEISIFHVWHSVRARRDVASGDIEAYCRELGWREFAHHVLYHFPHTPTNPLQVAFSEFPWRDGHETMLHAWQQGRTGFPIVDAGLRQLWQSGWMHNRVRMIVASLLVKNIRAPWLSGAKWFWDTLVDADLAANTLGWQWAAGCGADAAPYFRIFNPVRQGQTFDPDGAYVRRWVPELAALPDRYVHAPWTLPRVTREQLSFVPGRDYAEPIVDLVTSRREALEALQRVARRQP